MFCITVLIIIYYVHNDILWATDIVDPIAFKELQHREVIIRFLDRTKNLELDYKNYKNKLHSSLKLGS